MFTHLEYDFELILRCNLISNELWKAETSTRVLPELCGSIPSASPGGERLKLPFKDYLARWILAPSPPLPTHILKIWSSSGLRNFWQIVNSEIFKSLCIRTRYLYKLLHSTKVKGIFMWKYDNKIISKNQSLLTSLFWRKGELGKQLD